MERFEVLVSDIKWVFICNYINIKIGNLNKSLIILEKRIRLLGGGVWLKGIELFRESKY